MFGIVENGICVDIGQLKKILIEDWPRLHRRALEEKMKGEEFYRFILGEIADCADALSYRIRDAEAKRLGRPGGTLDWQDYYPKSDVRSIGLEVLNFLNGVCAGPIEILTTDDIPVILEFLDTPPDKSVEAWDKWEKYWDSLDYQERRRQLFEKIGILKEVEKVEKTILNTEHQGGIKEAQEFFDKIKKEFASRELRREGIMTMLDVQRMYSQYEDDTYVQLVFGNEPGCPRIEITDEKSHTFETITFKE
jgi:hypothetical protein